MKKLTAILLILVLALALAACGETKTDEDVGTNEADVVVTDNAAEADTGTDGIPEEKIYADIWEQTAI